MRLGMPRGTRGTRSLRSPAVFPRSVPRWLEFSTPSPFPEFPCKVNILKFFTKKCVDSYYIWLFLISILSIPCYFVISNHENHFLLLISKKKILFNKKKFQIDFKFEIKCSPKFPRPHTRNPGNRVSPKPRGMKIAGEFASLNVTRIQTRKAVEVAYRLISC